MSQPYRVMLVDDSAVTLKKLEHLMHELGHQVVHSCQSGEEACSDYFAVMPDLVTMDITMNDMNGIEATRRIINSNGDARVVVVTSHGQEQMVMDAIGAGAQGYLLKPIRMEKLREVIEQVMS